MHFVSNNTLCRRADLLLTFFFTDLRDSGKPCKPHECCDVCQRGCKCNGDPCSFVYFPPMKSSFLPEPVLQGRPVTCNQPIKLHVKLEYLKTTFSKNILDTGFVKNAALFTSPELLSGLVRHKFIRH